MTGSGTILGTINMVRAVSSLSMIPVSGILIDRFKRRHIFLFDNSVLFIITLLLGLLLVSGHSHISYLFIFSLLGGLVQTVNQALRQVLVFDMVPRSHTPNAVALIQTGWSIMRSFGPLLGGFLILWFGPGGNFLVQAGAYALIFISIVNIQFQSQITETVHGSPLQSFKEGISYIRKEHVTRTFMFMGFVLPLLIAPIYTILPPIFAVKVFGDNSGKILGFLMGAVGIGGIIGGIVTASLGHMQRRGILQLSALFLQSITLIAFAFCSNLWMALFFLMLSGFFEIIFMTTNQTLLQLSIPDNLRGRITSVVNLNSALAPMGGLIAGTISDFLGGPKVATIILATITAVIAASAFLFSSTIRNYKLN
jgi:MFS family permease